MEKETYRRMAEIQEHHWWYEARRSIIAAMISRLKLPANAEILEVGCGPGANLNMLKSFGTVIGIEPDNFAIDHARKVSGCRIEQGFLPDDLRLDTTFDLVGAFDVIEHVDPDRESLHALYKVTKPGGYAMFTVPAYRFLWSRHDEVNHHKHRYTRPEFRALLKDAGYDVQFISYYNTLLFPLIASMRLLKSLLKLKDNPDDSMPRWPFVNDILGTIFASERYLLKLTALPFGVSIIAVCRKT